jgi:hypothetical protein
MPRAADLYLTGALPADHSPLDRIDFQPHKLPPFDLEAFLDGWTLFIEEYLFPLIEDLTGVDLTFLVNILDKIRDFIGIDNWTDPFNLVEVIAGFIQHGLVPGGVLNFDIFGALLQGNTGVENPGFPYEFPVGFSSGEPNLVELFFQNLQNLLDPLDLLDSGFNPVEAVQTLINLVLLPQNILASLGDVKSMAQVIINAFDSIPIPVVNDLLSSAAQLVWDVISGLFGMGTTNSAGISELFALITKPDAGTQWHEEFDGNTNGPVPSRFTVRTFGSGSGFWKLDGNGRLVWNLGSGQRGTYVIETADALTTNKQYAAFGLAAVRADLVSPRQRLVVRSDADGLNCVRLDISSNTAQMQSVIDGDVFDLGAGDSGFWSGTRQNGEKWELFAGYNDEDRRYVVKRQGQTVIDVTEDGEESLLPTGPSYAGFGALTGFNFFSLQVEPSPITFVGASDWT